MSVQLGWCVLFLNFCLLYHDKMSAVQKVKKLEQEVEVLRSSSSGVGSVMTSVAGSIEENIDRMSVPASDRRTESMGSGSSGPVEPLRVSGQRGIVIVIINAFKGAVQDFLQSSLFATNCLQHERSSGRDAIVCKSCAAHRALVMLCYVPHGMKRQFSY